MEKIISMALGAMSPEEQVKARIALYELHRSGFLQAAAKVANDRFIEIIPSRVADAGVLQVISEAIAERGYAMSLLEVMDRYKSAPGGRPEILGANGIKMSS